MSDYERPLVIAADDLAEGVFMSSGGTAGKSEASYTLKQTNAWDGNKQYDMMFTNNLDKKVDSVTVTVSCHGKVNSIGGNVSGVIQGDTAQVTFNNYNNGIEAKATLGPIYVLVTGEGDFGIQ